MQIMYNNCRRCCAFRVHDKVVESGVIDKERFVSWWVDHVMGDDEEDEDETPAYVERVEDPELDVLAAKKQIREDEWRCGTWIGRAHV